MNANEHSHFSVGLLDEVRLDVPFEPVFVRWREDVHFLLCQKVVRILAILVASASFQQFDHSLCGNVANRKQVFFVNDAASFRLVALLRQRFN